MTILSGSEGSTMVTRQRTMVRVIKAARIAKGGASEFGATSLVACRHCGRMIRECQQHALIQTHIFPILKSNLLFLFASIDSVHEIGPLSPCFLLKE
jgi:hypothetical protein